MTARTVLRGGTLVDAESGSRPGDLALAGGRIVAAGTVPAEPGDRVVDCGGRQVQPGMIDTHSHADGQIFDDEVALALLRQGVTTVIAGQDGVSYAPGDGRFATDYFAAINGAHPTYTGSTVADLLATYDRTTGVNVGYLVPAGVVRQQVMGLRPDPPTAEELAAMQALVRAGLAEGALGLSSGLDYVPGLFADTAELTALCEPVAAADGVYVTHMRGGYEDNSAVGIAEVVKICADAGVRGHISHFHARPEIITTLVDAAAGKVDLTFDSYPYSRGCSLLGMLMLPPDLVQQGLEACIAQLEDPVAREAVAARWIPVLVARADMGPGWAENVRFAHIAANEFGWAHGLSLAAAAAQVDTTPGELGLRVLAASRLEVSVVMRTPVERSDDEIAQHLGHPRHMGGSDGIYLGRAAHPRGWGAFIRYLDTFTRQRGDLSWAQGVERFSAAPAQRFGLAGRGSLRPGSYADVVLVDPAAVRVRADYDDPRQPADGITDVWVNGEQVLVDGALSGVRSGKGVRRLGS